jgi:hypothetical protein
MSSTTYFNASATYASNANGTSKTTYTSVLQILSPRIRIAIPITARTADANISIRLQHSATEEGPWADYGSAAQITDTTDALALLLGTASSAVNGPIMPYVRLAITVTDRTGPNGLVSFTAAPYAVWEAFTAGDAGLSLQRPAEDASYESAANGAAEVTYVTIPNSFDGSVLRAFLDVTTRPADTDIDVTLEQAVTSSGPWASVGTLISDTSDDTGAFTGYLSESTVGPLLPYLRLGISVADRGAAAQRTIVATVWVETDSLPMPDGTATAPASTGITNQNATATNANATATNQATTATNSSTNLSGTHNFGAPVAANDAGVHAAVLPSAPNDFPGPFTDPDVPRSLRVKFGAGWDGGNITVVGTDQFDAAVSEEFVANPGATVGGAKTFKTVTSASKTNALGAGGNGASIGFSNRLGIGSAATFTPKNYGGYGVGSLTADGISEAGEYLTGTNEMSVKPTTAPDGAIKFVAIVSADRTITQAAHNHTQDAHTHVQAAHTHTVTDPTHVHVN